RHPNSAQPQRVGLPSKRDVVRRSNWFGSQPNSAPPPTSNLTTTQPMRPAKLLMKPDLLMTYLPRILMTNWTSTTNQTTNHEELVSSGAANATAGVFATTAPTPSTNARTPARTMFCASTAKRSGENRRGH